MNRLCTRLLVTAKLDPGKIGLKTASVNLEELIMEEVAHRKQQAERDRISVVVEDSALAVQVDRGMLSMITFLNTWTTRSKYSTPGTLIEISTHKSDTEAIVTVHNIGSTIRIEDRERVFDRFYRSADQVDTAPGTGIGLSVVKKAAQAHHGHVWVISSEKDGTTFFLSLPIGERRKQRVWNN